MKYLQNGFYGMAIMALVAMPVSESVACGACATSDSATAGFSDFGWIHMLCCGSLLVIGLILLLFQKSNEQRGKN